MTDLERAAGAEREAPAALLQRLRRIEPLAELAYVGHNKWWLGRRDPNGALAQAGREKVRAALAAPQMTPDSVLTYRVGRLQQAGFVFIAEYEGEPDGRIEKDLEVMDFLWKAHATEQRWQAAMEREQRESREAAHKDLTDEARAKDAWNYWRKGTFATKRIDLRRTRSGWTTHRSIA